MSDVFAQEDRRHGYIPNLKMKLNLNDDKPVQKIYNFIPKPLYKELKEYVHKPAGERLYQEIHITILIPGGLSVQEGQQPAVMCRPQRAESQDHH